MDFFDLVEFVLSPYIHVVFAVVAIGLGYPIARSIGDPTIRYRHSRCPLRIALPFAGLLVLTPIGLSIPGAEWLFGLVANAPAPVWWLLQPTLLFFQAKWSIHAIRDRHEWPATTLPFVVLLGVWILPVAIMDLAMMVGPMVK